MRRIDLTCLIASPIVAGLLLNYTSLQVAILAIMAWNLLAWMPECLLLSYAQRQSPSLRWVLLLHRSACYIAGSDSAYRVCSSRSVAQKFRNRCCLTCNLAAYQSAHTRQLGQASVCKNLISRVFSSRQQELVKEQSGPAGGLGTGIDVKGRLQESMSAWRCYAEQDVVLAAVALALLYLTVMSFVRPSPLSISASKTATSFNAWLVSDMLLFRTWLKIERCWHACAPFMPLGCVSLGRMC